MQLHSRGEIQMKSDKKLGFAKAKKMHECINGN